MLQLAAVALGGAVGSVARYVLTTWAQRRFAPFPAGTLLVNVAGCLLIGIIVSLALLPTPDGRPRLGDTTQRLLVTGFLGGLTTFSAFGWESVTLLRDAHYLPAFWSVAGNLILGFAAVALGRWLVLSLLG